MIQRGGRRADSPQYHGHAGGQGLGDDSSVFITVLQGAFRSDEKKPWVMRKKTTN